jgi:GNAT superfamily N-acetyltransferase
MSAFDDAALYGRGVATLIASWQAYARGTSDAEVARSAGAEIAVFPHPPERDVYNNALLGRDLPATGRATVLDAIEATYAEAGVNRFAAWVHEHDPSMRAEVERRGYTLDTTTRSMGMALDRLRLPRPELDVTPLDWSSYLRRFGLPPDLLDGADHAAFHLLAARLDGEPVAAALAFDHEGDCGIYNVSTLQHARRRGLASALTICQVHAARARGCRTASLQATAMAEHLYTAIGFRDLGRFLEYVPAPSTIRSAT